MAELSADAQRRLAALEDSYRRGLPAKAEAIEAAYAAFGEDPEELAICEELKTLVHRLAGSAATYGFAQLGESAKAMDLNLRAYLDASATTRTGLREELDATYRVLNTAITEACRGEE